MRDYQAISTQLQRLGLSQNETKIFVTLLTSPKNPTEVSRLTGIARSNVYRIVDELTEKGILREITTGNDKLVATADPAALELLVIEQENTATAIRSQFEDLLPVLNQFADTGNDLGIKTYRSIGGLKQMLWNELKHEEIFIFSPGSLNQGTGKRWAEKYRKEVITRGIVQYALENSNNPTGTVVADHPNYDKHYIVHYLLRETLDIQSEISIHGDVISVYNSWSHNPQLGAEIHNPFLAKLMRQVFEHYWELGKQERDA